MIGIIKDEDYVVLEFYPIFGSEKGIPNWASIKVKASPKYFGEYGIAWSNWGVWISWGNTTYCSFAAFFAAARHRRL